MTKKKLKLYTPNEEKSEYENFAELTAKLLKVKKKEIDKEDSKKANKDGDETVNYSK